MCDKTNRKLCAVLLIILRCMASLRFFLASLRHCKFCTLWVQVTTLHKSLKTCQYMTKPQSTFNVNTCIFISVKKTTFLVKKLFFWYKNEIGQMISLYPKKGACLRNITT